MLNTGEPMSWPDEVSLGGQMVPVDTAFADGDTECMDQHRGIRGAPAARQMAYRSRAQAVRRRGEPGGMACGDGDRRCARHCAAHPHHTAAVPQSAGRLLAGLLMAIDGVSIVMSRTGLLDIFIMVFALGAFSLLLIHRDWAAARLRMAAQSGANRPPQITFSWWRAGAAVLLGCATGVKWSGIYFFAVFCVISVFWDAWMIRQAGFRSPRQWLARGVFGDGLLAALYMVPLYAATYLLTWVGWFVHPNSYMRNWAATHTGQGVQWLPADWRSFVAYHAEMWRFHTTLDAPHDYKANPLTWPLQIRPTSFYWQKLDGHPGLCSLSPRSQCVAAVTSLGNPLIWWLGSLCAVLAIVIAILKRGDWRIWRCSPGSSAAGCRGPST